MFRARETPLADSCYEGFEPCFSRLGAIGKHFGKARLDVTGQSQNIMINQDLAITTDTRTDANSSAS